MIHNPSNEAKSLPVCIKEFKDPHLRKLLYHHVGALQQHTIKSKGYILVDGMILFEHLNR